jgi:hypothetical protein
MCRVLRVSPSGFYAWPKRDPSARAVRDAEVLDKLRAFHQRSDGTYGAPRLWKDLRELAGLKVGQKRVARLMRAAWLVGVSRRRGVRRKERRLMRKHTQEASELSTPKWEMLMLETWARAKIQESLRAVLEQEVTELLGRLKSVRRAPVDAPLGYRSCPGGPDPGSKRPPLGR